MKKWGITARLAVGLILGSGPMQPANAAGTVAFAGGNAKENASYFYVGFVRAWNGDLGSDGILLRGVGGYGNYSYTVPATIDGTLTELDATLGYQTFANNMRLTGYAGVNYQDHDLSPNDPGNSTRGGKIGFKIQGEIETVGQSPFYLSLISSYSTANTEYWNRLRLGYKFSNITAGPEVILDGSTVYSGTRLGGFATFDLANGWKLDAGVGSAHVDGTQGGNGIYGSLGISIAF